MNNKEFFVLPVILLLLALAILAAGCTGVAFVVFYRLLANAGPTIAMAVAYLIPVFANLWSWLLLGEAPTQSIVVGCSMILTGTTLATGMIRARPAKSP